MTKIEKLEHRVKELEAERQNWLTEKVFTVERIIQKVPEDYNAMRQRVKELERENQRLEKIIQYGNISSAVDLIEEFQSSAKTFYRKLANELNYCLMNFEERKALRDFIAYLKFVERELERFVIEDKKNVR